VIEENSMSEKADAKTVAERAFKEGNYGHRTDRR